MLHVLQRLELQHRSSCGQHEGGCHFAGALRPDTRVATGNNKSGPHQAQVHSSTSADLQVQEAEAAQDLTSWPGFASDSSLQLPGSLLTMSEQSISFGAFPITTAASRLLVLSCTAAVPITFQWQIGVFSKAAGEVFWCQ